MTKTTKTIFSTVALCVVIAFASAANVNASDHDITFNAPIEHQGHKHQGSKHKMKRMAKALSLSEQQQVQIKAIKKQAKEQHKSLRASMAEFKIAEQKLLQRESFSEQEYSILHNTYQAVFAQVALIRAKTKHAVFNVLTAEQQLKWLKITKRRQKNANKVRG
ncbi:MAG: Spy/CpxP family protein refolding chaperone [Colwellia sp.]|nr:Spy/CpxP family protein refolding chaperone [Colwellia sp.]